MTRRGSVSRAREALYGAVLVCGSLALVFLALEAALRLTLPERGDWYAAGPRRVEFLREHVRRNPEGFRDGPFDVPKPAGTCRILVLGDSFTFGDGIPNAEDVWPEVLERRLAAAHLHVQVFNAAIPGTNTSWQSDLLRKRGWGWEPDRIVVGFVPNDPEPPGANRDAVPRRLNPPLLPLGSLDARLTRTSFAYSWLRGQKNALLERWGLKETYADYVASLYVDGPDWNRFVDAARSLVGDARGRGVPVTVVVFPLFHDLEHDRFRVELDRAAGIFRDAGAEIVDLRETYRGMASADLWISPTDAHPNERAHRLAGEAVADSLLTRTAGPCGRSDAARSKDGVDERSQGALGGQHDEQSQE